MAWFHTTEFVLWQDLEREWKLILYFNPYSKKMWFFIFIFFILSLVNQYLSAILTSYLDFFLSFGWVSFGVFLFFWFFYPSAPSDFHTYSQWQRWLGLSFAFLPHSSQDPVQLQILIFFSELYFLVAQIIFGKPWALFWVIVTVSIHICHSIMCCFLSAESFSQPTF